VKTVLEIFFKVFEKVTDLSFFSLFDFCHSKLGLKKSRPISPLANTVSNFGMPQLLFPFFMGEP
jgi:hypothetical protein